MLMLEHGLIKAMFYLVLGRMRKPKVDKDEFGLGSFSKVDRDRAWQPQRAVGAVGLLQYSLRAHVLDR